MSLDSEWDARYAAATGTGMFSGNVNGTLAVEVSGMKPGRVLDVGCGEGADALWLAQHGWDVTGLDVSAVAIQRAASKASACGMNVRWLVADLAAAPLSTFDLVSVFYPALKQTPDQGAQRALLAAVAPGGLLLVVGHAPLDREYSRKRGFDLADYVQPENIKHALDDGWTVELDELRPRPGGAPHGSPFTHDHVLRVRRR